MDKVQALGGSGLADPGVTVAEVGNANAGGEVQEPPAVLELNPRSLGTDHDRITSNPPQSLRNVLGTDVL